MPNNSLKPSTIMGMERENGSKRKRRPKTRPRKRAARWERSSNRSWETCSSTPVFCSDLQEEYEQELAAVHEAYPNTQVWMQDEGLWLMTESSLLEGSQTFVKFVTCIPFSYTLSARSWGFWAGIEWIGPRHTNFPDGSICAYLHTDGVWNIGDPIVDLLDLYTLWALRHLHLRVFGRWPGQQVAFHPYERILELNDDEWCGCGSDKKYVDCCKENDLQSDLVSNAINFTFYFEGALRGPPDDIQRFVHGMDDPPQIKDVLSIL